MRYLFEEYVFDTDRRELHRGADLVSVAPQVFDILDYLIRNRERVVSKDDLLEAIWKGRIVSEAALTTRLNAARTAIGDCGEAQRLIKTLPRKGFRFVGEVRESPKPDPLAAVHDQQEARIVAALPLPDKPSIAVLPFSNLSSDPEQDYFADGVVEDITMALSLFRWLFVVARNSSFAYKGRPVDVKQVGRELGVRYVLEGSVRRAGKRVRIAAQLIDAETGAHLWADRFEGPVEDMFDLQDHLTSSVVGAIAPKLQHEEIKRARRKPTENLDAYDYYLRGLAKARWSKHANSDALDLFYKAIELDPRLACAYGMAAWCHVRRKALGEMNDQPLESAEAIRLARKAVDLGADDPFALSMGAYALAFVAREFDDAADFMDRALAVNPNLARAWMLSAWLRVWRGEPDLVLEHCAHAMRLSPLDPSMYYTTHSAMAYAHFLAGRHDIALSCAEKAMRDNPAFLLTICIYAASGVLAGRMEPARRAISRALEDNPGLTASSLSELTPFRRPENFAIFAKALRNAGLPD
ncbi:MULTISPECIES: winged helix-turn-helix domain-containing protein [unclassified Bradyrhizobium]|uniref:winged helix-turn-helix domain-containing tetratricopeptide repeat protein n=1 Tax=unclassified Bradyrhizobium TaxID=2631580 RepID=UPI00247B19CD|nr:MULTISPECIES: winged helix-turn-helix domain-containing protein [unclassified Bradyrhizobium]WGR69300.1 winged helix-turn-helix domain-containing protein [Bradyrhizobium sp. ISRA426]WGR81355.1 winged helix-turn-helix domain-containing protein [Bradyrhizobium sp. ISRA430]WGR84539.1 winged helix-turn-helix domain-containing protein [Bradyrhizobium sp. ISRA432]